MKINIDNIDINYIVQGDKKEKILLLHGWGANIKLFNNIIDFLSKTKTVYALDMPGFGESQQPPYAWNVDNYVDLVIKFINEMKIEKLSILGHSFGGRVIIKLVNRKKLNFVIDKIVLVDSAGIKPKKSIKNIIKVRAFKIGKKIVSTNLVKKIYPNALENLKNKFGSQDYKSASPIMRESLVKTVNEDLTYLLKNISQPTLLIWGDKDTATPIKDAYLMNKLIPDSGIVKIENAGHYSFLEQPVLVNRVLESFLGVKE